jgi:hypothetical protein
MKEQKKKRNGKIACKSTFRGRTLFHGKDAFCAIFAEI